AGCVGDLPGLLPGMLTVSPPGFSSAPLDPASAAFSLLAVVLSGVDWAGGASDFTGNSPSGGSDRFVFAVFVSFGSDSFEPGASAGFASSAFDGVEALASAGGFASATSGVEAAAGVSGALLAISLGAAMEISASLI